MADSDEAKALKLKIDAQGEKVRVLKTSGGAKVVYLFLMLFQHQLVHKLHYPVSLFVCL